MNEPTIRKLTKRECPEGSWLGWISDVHIGIQHDAALKLAVECFERNGVERVAAVGDIYDLACLSRHPKEAQKVVEHSTVLEEVESGRWFTNWMATRDTMLVLGNHEDRVKRFVDENPALYGSSVGNFASVVNLPSAIEVLPQGSEIRLGNLALFHGDDEFKRGTGGKYPANKLLDMLPDQSSICGHVHRMHQACRTSRDEDGINRTRRAYTMGHMSCEWRHRHYAGKHPNWQMGFALIRVYWEGSRPRWTVYPIEVLFDRYNRPYFEFMGKVHR